MSFQSCRGQRPCPGSGPKATVKPKCHKRPALPASAQMVETEATAAPALTAVLPAPRSPRRPRVPSGFRLLSPLCRRAGGSAAEPAEGAQRQGLVRGNSRDPRLGREGKWREGGSGPSGALRLGDPSELQRSLGGGACRAPSQSGLGSGHLGRRWGWGRGPGLAGLAVGSIPAAGWGVGGEEALPS